MSKGKKQAKALHRFAVLVIVFSEVVKWPKTTRNYETSGAAFEFVLSDQLKIRLNSNVDCLRFYIKALEGICIMKKSLLTKSSIESTHIILTKVKSKFNLIPLNLCI